MEVSELIVTELIKTYNIMFSVFVLVFMWMDGVGAGRGRGMSEVFFVDFFISSF